MTDATKTLLARLAQHVGDVPEKRRALIAYCRESTGRTLYRGMLLKYIRLRGQPTADFLLPILCWLQLEGVIVSSSVPGGLFTYSRGTKAASKTPRPASKPAANSGRNGRKGAR